MIQKRTNSSQEKLNSFIKHLEEARKLQNDIIMYGLDTANLYVEDLDGDWLERWDEEEQNFVDSVTTFLESNDAVALRVRKQLKDKSLLEIATELENSLSFTQTQDRIFAVKNILVDTTGYSQVGCELNDDCNTVDLLDLAEKLVRKLTDILRESSQYGIPDSE
ncbi:MAG: hypothetical protein AAF208_13360 [Cyanobacteria bacterium P01_A01_bin.45]